MKRTHPWTFWIPRLLLALWLTACASSGGSMDTEDENQQSLEDEQEFVVEDSDR